MPLYLPQCTNACTFTLQSRFPGPLCPGSHPKLPQEVCLVLLNVDTPELIHYHARLLSKWLHVCEKVSLATTQARSPVTSLPPLY